MKKTLLALALCSIATGAFAQDNLMEFNERFALSYEGADVAPGSTVKATHFVDVSDLYGEGTVTYSLDIKVENLDIMPQYIRGVLKAYKPTMSEYLSDRYFWGDPQLCYSVTDATGEKIGGCLAGDPSNLFNPNFGFGNLQVPVVGEFEWQLHVTGCEVASQGLYQLTLQAVEVSDPNDFSSYTPISKSVDVLLDFSAAASGVEEITVDNLDGEYYDLQGRRVANPTKGLYIYKTADKAVKRFVK